MHKHFAARALSALLCVAAVHSYDVGCLYPTNMPDPLTAQYEMALALSLGVTARGVETPMVIRSAHLTTYCTSNCIAYHDADALNVLTKQSPSFRTPSAYHNSWSRMLCIAQCWGFLDLNDGIGDLTDAFADWQFNLQSPNAELFECGDDAQCIGALLVASDWDPQLIGQIVVGEIRRIVQNDGWNAVGASTYDAETGEVVPCTANCAPYSDTTGYYVVNNADFDVQRRGKGDKYMVRGVDRRWQPIQEHDESGYFSRQEHVTPHIGYTVTPFVIEEWKRAPNPRYAYKEEADLVVQRLADLASDEERKSMTAFFDNKLLVRGLIQHYVRYQYPDQTFEEQMLFIHVLSAVEVDALLQAWREKVRHDLVRPTTVIQRWGSDIIHTFNGDRASTAPESIAARDFQAFQRVMPHSEYPSGSACLCTAYAEITDLYVTQRWNSEYDSIGPMFVGGDDNVDDNGVPQFDLCAVFGQFPCTPEQRFVLENMDDLKRVCGQSRLWGGMHFTASVSAAEEICDGIGALGMKLFDELKADSSWGQTFVEFPEDANDNRDQRPSCDRR